MVNLFINIDNGILPAGSVKIKEDYNLDNSRFGALGSFVYFGQMMGSAMATVVLSYIHPKYVLAACLTLNIGCLLVFTWLEQYYYLLCSRMFTGLF